MSRPWFKQRAPKFVAEIEANLLPVMNIMFLLIPALLLAMEFASMAAIPIKPPTFCGGCDGAATEPPPKPLKFSLEILEDGFRTSLHGEAPGEIIPLHAGSHDFAALAAEAAKLKQGYPDEARVTVSADPRIRMATLVETLDTLRGSNCSLAGAFQGEQVPETCLFWQPIITSRG